jgi:hypothetical protein
MISSALADVSQRSCGIHLMQAVAGRFELAASHIACAVQQLALQVGEVHHIMVDEPQRAHPGGREVEGHRRAEAAGTHDQHAGGLEALLPLRPHARENEVSPIAVALGSGERGHFVVVIRSHGPGG